jgi:hypothetical protein
MISRESAETPACTGERLPQEFHVFDEGRPPASLFCPRTVEILTVLNDVFDAFAPADGLAVESA